jgi:hypothetical protein
VTFTIKVRGGGGPMIAEYWCENHERIERLVDRDENGDPPERIQCEEPIELHGKLKGIFVGDVFPCDRWCELVISAANPKVVSVVASAAVRGGDMKDRPPGMLDTRPLAEGMPMSEWKKLQKNAANERRHQRLIAAGIKSKKVQVG